MTTVRRGTFAEAVASKQVHFVSHSRVSTLEGSPFFATLGKMDNPAPTLVGSLSTSSGAPTSGLQGLALNLLGHLGYAKSPGGIRSALFMAFYMAPNLNNELFATHFARYFLLNQAQKAVKKPGA